MTTEKSMLVRSPLPKEREVSRLASLPGATLNPQSDTRAIRQRDSATGGDVVRGVLQKTQDPAAGSKTNTSAPATPSEQIQIDNLEAPGIWLEWLCAATPDAGE
jgi:hypothetical protein